VTVRTLQASLEKTTTARLPSASVEAASGDPGALCCAKWNFK
jgi:hypothetical protein